MQGKKKKQCITFAAITRRICQVYIVSSHSTSHKLSDCIRSGESLSVFISWLLLTDTMLVFIFAVCCWAKWFPTGVNFLHSSKKTVKLCGWEGDCRVKWSFSVGSLVFLILPLCFWDRMGQRRWWRTCITMFFAILYLTLWFCSVYYVFTYASQTIQAVWPRLWWNGPFI